MNDGKPPEDSGPSVEGVDVWHGTLRYTRLFDIRDEPAPPKMVGPFGSAEGQTLFFGDGGSGKSILVLTMLCSVAGDMELIEGMAPTLSGPVGWLDFENKRRATRHRAGVLTGAEVPIIYIPCLGSMWDEVERVRTISETEGLVALGVDSVGYAMGSGRSAKDDEPARMFTQAVADIELPTLGIAHVPRDTANQTKPYGSAFWHNGASQTWSVAKTPTPGHVIRLINYKDNDGERAQPVVLEVEWGERIVVRRSKASPPDDELLLAVEKVGPASTEVVLDRLVARGWLISAGTLTDHLVRLEKAGRIHRTGRTRDTRWEAQPTASNGAPNGPGAGSDHPPNETPNAGRNGARRDANGAE